MRKSLIIFFGIIILIFIMLGILRISLINKKEEAEEKNQNHMANKNINNETKVILNDIPKNEKKITDWRLVLVNYENELPTDFTVALSNIDQTRQFDSRAIEYLLAMQKQMKKDGITGAWVQSAYRSIKYQQQLYSEKVQEYMAQGFSKEEAEDLTAQNINKPEASEHNLGLAVDFNYVDLSFEKTKAFAWLQENAEKYGFILRYKKEKEDITKVVYEPWHWRFVGKEHAIAMNNLDMCLEEYVEYLKEQ